MLVLGLAEGVGVFLGVALVVGLALCAGLSLRDWLQEFHPGVRTTPAPAG